MIQPLVGRFDGLLHAGYTLGKAGYFVGHITLLSLDNIDAFPDEGNVHLKSCFRGSV
jgi:hypothetical protein